ncbi:hypothetical protein ACFSO7_15615 [Bacillus sp. CGMCC 1.16607]|uniref:hypothetical protein n=1 Tax=Bacillus sp. CGMCC 1.16607 TaxID=3351842 RepID=UPI00363D492F
MVKLSNRVARVFRLAEEEILFKKVKVVMPIHLLIACLVERTGVLGEILFKGKFDVDALRAEGERMYETQTPQAYNNPYFSIPISKEVEMVLEVAQDYMHRYKQIF